MDRLKKYFSLDSAFRDRIAWPSQADYEVKFNKTGVVSSSTTVRDPISLASPLLEFNSTFDIVGSDDTLTLTAVSATVSPDPLPTLDSGDSSKFYVSGATNMNTTNYFYIGAVANNTTLGVARRIANLEFVGGDFALLTLKSPYPDSFSDGDIITVRNPSSNTTTPHIFIAGGVPIDRRYLGCFITHYAPGFAPENAIITDYDGDTRIARLGTQLTNWSNTDSYALRKSLYAETGALLASATTSDFNLPAGNTIDYTGAFIRIVDGAAAGDVRPISSFNTTTRVGAPSSPFSAVPGAGDIYELLPFTRDNEEPLRYVGASASNQSSVAHTIKLLTLTLPNVMLNNGGYIKDYPYVYVQFYPKNSSMGQSSTSIYSNNPNSRNGLFMVPIDEKISISSSSFIELSGSGMTQMITFAPRGIYQFGVVMPDGSYFTTTVPDRTSPAIPNEDLQISATFEIMRVT
jgi:hypothetical protein